MPETILAEDIANQLRRSILRGVLPPGSPIKERDNAARLGVSRTPMREAIRILAKEGLVDLRPARSPLVVRPDIKEVEDNAQVLVALEQLSVELACRAASDAEIDALAAIVTSMERDFKSADPLDTFETDMSFHTAIAEASHNLALAETHRSFLQKLWRLRYLTSIQRRNLERVVDHHGQIVESLRSRDVVAAKAAIELHLGNLANDMRSVLLEEAAEAENNKNVKAP